MDIYQLCNAKATKYFTLSVKEKKTDNVQHYYLSEYIEKTNNDITFHIMKGKHDADCIRIYGWSEDVYSDKFVAMLEENGVNNLDKYLVNIDDTRYELKNKYYWILTKSKIPKIPCVKNEEGKKHDIDEYCKKNNIGKDNILVIGERWYLYGDFSKWDGSKIFWFADGCVFYVTDEIKRVSEKMKLKNIYYEKIEKYE